MATSENAEGQIAGKPLDLSYYKEVSLVRTQEP